MTVSSLLVVDDDQAELALVTRLAKDTFPGVRLRMAADAQAAHDACGTEQFDCVILDYNMPGMNGLACAQRMRATFPYLAIVMSTNAGDEMLAARAMTSGVTDYIPKSRMTALSLDRVVRNAMRISNQARVIDEQRSELESFAYTLAHDFKQPIRQIKTFVNLVSEGIRDGKPDDIGQHLTFLNQAARRLGDLVDVMSQYTLLNRPPVIGNIDLNEVFASVRASLVLYIAERGGRVTHDRAPIVWGNEALLSQVLHNLVVNGLKYNESAAPAVHIATEEKAGHCVIRVRDNGIGIEPQYLSEIFKPLVRLHTKSKYSGTGLGLTLARKALTAMGGSIACHSQVGAGTEFVVKIGVPTRTGRKNGRENSRLRPPSDESLSIRTNR
jgi:two-component system sensor histidine kinase/response regulator